MRADDEGMEADLAPGQRERAVGRALKRKREHAELRVQRILDAALQLLSDPEIDEFTVQQVVELSGESARGFYLYFAGKHELLLALFEDAVRFAAAHLAERLEQVDDPLQRLRLLTVEYHDLCRPETRHADDRASLGAIARFAKPLFTSHPREASAAFQPVFALLHEELRRAAMAGKIRQDVDHRHVAGIVLQSLMFNAFAGVISGASHDDGAGEFLWDLLLTGLAAAPGVGTGAQRAEV